MRTRITRRVRVLLALAFFCFSLEVLGEREAALRRILENPQGRSRDEIHQAYRALARMYHPDTLGPNATPEQKAAAHKKMSEINNLKDRALNEPEPVAPRPGGWAPPRGPTFWEEAVREAGNDPIKALEAYSNAILGRTLQGKRVLAEEDIRGAAEFIARTWDSVIMRGLPERLRYADLIRGLAQFDETTQDSAAWKDLKHRGFVIAERALEVGDPSAPQRKYHMEKGRYLDAVKAVLVLAQNEPDVKRVLDMAERRYPTRFGGTFPMDLLDHYGDALLQAPHGEYMLDRIGNTQGPERAALIRKAMALAEESARVGHFSYDKDIKRQMEERYAFWAQTLRSKADQLPMDGVFGSKLEGKSLDEVLKILSAAHKTVLGMPSGPQRTAAADNLVEAFRGLMNRFPQTDEQSRVALATQMGKLHRELASGHGVDSQADALRELSGRIYSEVLGASPNLSNKAAVAAFQGRLGGYRVELAADFPQRLIGGLAPSFKKDPEAARDFAQQLIPDSKDAQGLARLFPAGEGEVDKVLRATRFIAALDAWLPAGTPQEAQFKAEMLQKLRQTLRAAGQNESAGSLDSLLVDIQKRHPSVRLEKPSLAGKLWNAIKGGGGAACLAAFGALP